jgi:hypothetical protein
MAPPVDAHVYLQLRFGHSIMAIPAFGECGAVVDMLFDLFLWDPVCATASTLAESALLDVCIELEGRKMSAACATPTQGTLLKMLTVLILWKRPSARVTHSLWAVFAMLLPLRQGDFGFVAPPAMLHLAYSTMLSLIFPWVPQVACEALPK